MRLYLGNLPYTTTESEIRAQLQAFDTVEDVKIISDRESGQSRGYGFATLATNEGGQRAITAMHQTSFGGRSIVVSVAKERSEKRSGGGQSYGW